MTVRLAIAKLSDLALIRFVLHIKDLCDLNRPMELIKDYIEERVPPHIANEYTKVLLQVMVEVMSEAIKHNDCLRQLATIHAVDMLLHSATTEIKIGFWELFPRVEIFKLKSPHIKSSREFDPCRPLCNNIGRYSQLREFTFDLCTDELIRELATNCTNLHKLVSGVTSDISDDSVHYILQFTKLKYLMIEGEKLTTQGTLDLLSGLSNRNIITFLAIHLKENHFEELPQTITHLDVIEVNKHDNSIKHSSLSRLKNIKSLTLRVFDFDDVKHLLLEVGSKLQKLGLRIGDVDLNFVAGACPFLQVLELHRVEYYSTEHPNFKTITSCIFHVPELNAAEGIVNKCPHVQNVVLLYHCQFYKLVDFFRDKYSDDYRQLALIEEKQIVQNEVYIGCEDDCGKFTSRMKVTVGSEIVVQSVGSSKLSDCFKDFVKIFLESTKLLD